MKTLALAAAFSIAALSVEAKDIDIVPLHESGLWLTELVLMDQVPVCSAVTNNPYGSFDVSLYETGAVSLNLYFPMAYNSPYYIKDLILSIDGKVWNLQYAEYGSGQISFWFEDRAVSGAFLNDLRTGTFVYMLDEFGKPLTLWPLKGSAEAIRHAEDCAAGYYHGNVIDAPMQEVEY